MKKEIEYVRPAFAGEIYSRRDVVNRSFDLPTWLRITIGTILAFVCLGGMRYVSFVFPPVTEFTKNGDCAYVIDERADRRDQKGCDFLAKYGGKYDGPFSMKSLD